MFSGQNSNHRLETTISRPLDFAVFRNAPATFNLFCSEGNSPERNSGEMFRWHGRKTQRNSGRNASQIFALWFPGKVAARNFMRNPPHFPRETKQKPFTARFWEWVAPTFWDTLREQICLSDQSALIDEFLWRIPFKTCAISPARNQKLNRANLYENEMVWTYRDLNCSGASPTFGVLWKVPNSRFALHG